MRRTFLVATVSLCVVGCRSLVGFESDDITQRAGSPDGASLTADGGAAAEAADLQVDASTAYFGIFSEGQNVLVEDPRFATCKIAHARMWGAGGGLFTAEEQMTVPGGPGGFTEISWARGNATGFRYWTGASGSLDGGGFPGGGSAGATQGHRGGGGGGYTALALADGTVVAVAGGGGGACFETDGVGGPGRGGAGGGATGLSGGGTYPGKGGDTSGGTGGAAMNPGAAGAPLGGGTGGGGATVLVPAAGGGGAGFFGGGGGGNDDQAFCGGGGGGSGFVNDERTISGRTVASADGSPPEVGDRERTAARAGEPGFPGLLVVWCDE